VLEQIGVHPRQYSSFSLQQAEEAIQRQHGTLQNPTLSAAAQRRGRRSLWAHRHVYLSELAFLTLRKRLAGTTRGR
jgi:hypothetical protein